MRKNLIFNPEHKKGFKNFLEDYVKLSDNGSDYTFLRSKVSDTLGHGKINADLFLHVY